MNELFVNIIKFENKLVHRRDLRIFFFSVPVHRKAKGFVNGAKGFLPFNLLNAFLIRTICNHKNAF